MIALVPVPSADKSTIRARQTCFCGEDGAEMIAARRRRSLGDTITQFLCASPSIAHLEIQRNPNSDSFVPVNPIGTGGGGGGDGGGGTAYDAAFCAVINEDNPTAGNIPTSDMPTSGTASYAGQTQLDLRDGSLEGEVFGKLTGDVDLTAVLANGTSPNVDRHRLQF
jgi:hypothetical protein